MKRFERMQLHTYQDEEKIEEGLPVRKTPHVAY